MADYPSIIKDLKSDIYSPVYFLQGEETFYIDSISDYMEQHALDESQKGFNQLIMYGKDTNLVEVISAARRYPMMGERQVVIVKEAQEISEWNKEDKQTLLLNYLENPLPSTILLFAYKYKTFDKRTKVGKALEKNAVFLTCKKLYDNQVPEWIDSYVKSQGLSIERNAVMLLSENIGNNLQRIANEIEKLSLNVNQGEAITVDMIQKFIGISKDYNIFEFQKAIGGLDKLKALKIAQYFGKDAKNNPSVLIVSGLFSYFSKLLLIHHSASKNPADLSRLIGVKPYFVKEYLVAVKNFPVFKVVKNLQIIHDADLQSKGIVHATVNEESLLTELVYKLMN